MREVGGRGGGGRNQDFHIWCHSLGTGHFNLVLSYCALTLYNCVQSSVE